MLKTENIKKVNVFREKKNIDSDVKEDANEQALTIQLKQNPVKRLIKHPFFTPLLYTISGGLLLFSLVVIFYTYVMRLKVETAVVNAMIETMVAPVGGYIKEVFISSGDQVKKGARLFNIENIDLERELQLARIQVEESKVTIAYYQQLLANEQQRLKIYKKVGSDRVISAQTLVNISEQEVMRSQHNLSRLTALHKKKYISEAQLEAEQTKYMGVQEKLKNAQAQQSLENHALKAVNKGMYFTGTKTEGIERDLYAELDAAQRREKLNEGRVKIYKNLVKKLTIKAPFDGKITQVLKSAGNTTDNIKPIIFIEKNTENKHIIAYLTQGEIGHISASASVKIYIPASGKTYRGKVIEINRTDGFIDAVKAQYQWRDFQIDRSAMVTIALQQPYQKEFNKHAFSGMPATVYFHKKW